MEGSNIKLQYGQLAREVLCEKIWNPHKDFTIYVEPNEWESLSIAMQPFSEQFFSWYSYQIYIALFQFGANIIINENCFNDVPLCTGLNLFWTDRQIHHIIFHIAYNFYPTKENEDIMFNQHKFKKIFSVEKNIKLYNTFSSRSFSGFTISRFTKHGVENMERIFLIFLNHFSKNICMIMNLTNMITISAII